MADLLTDRLKTMFSTAVSFHQRGDEEKARLIYEQIIQLDPTHSDALHLLGLVAAQNGNFQLAVEWMDKAIAIDAGNPAFYSNRGLALFKLGDVEGAIHSYRKAIETDSGFAQAHNNLGLALQASSRPDEALASFDRAISVFHGYAEAHYNKGLLLQKMHRYEDAISSYRSALSIEPEYADAHYNTGLALKSLGRFNDAIASYEACLRIIPASAEAHFDLGIVLEKINRLDEAIARYERAIAFKPDFVEAHNNRGRILKEFGRFSEAIASYDYAITLDPGFFEAYSNRGMALLRQNQCQAAIDSFTQAISIRSDYVDAYNNLGLAFHAAKRFDEAIASYDKALALRPDFAEAYSNRGLTLQVIGQLDAAIDCYNKALALRPELAIAKLNKGLVCLLRCNWAEGWSLYEWGFEAGRRNVSQKIDGHMWDGKVLQGTILVLPEQGVGDEIFYSGMLNDLQERVKSITVGVDPRLVSLYQRSFDHLKVVPSRMLPEMQSHDAQIYMASLGRYFRANDSDFKRVHSPYLKADPERIRNLRRQIAVEGKLICGLSWVSKNKDLGEDKSLLLQDLKPVLDLPGLEFVDLQYGDTGAERESLQESTGIRVRHVDEVDNFNDIDGLAALISACDVVITVSNTTAHLAGALGKAVMIMVPCSSGLFWYWHVDRSDSPWYPCAKLFRQKTVGRWDDVVEAVRQELQGFYLK